MALKTFSARDGSSWSVWRIESSAARDVAGIPAAWLLFQGEDESTRRRLVDFPENWESLPDERLDLLCRMATPARASDRQSPAAGIAQVHETAAAESGK